MQFKRSRQYYAIEYSNEITTTTITTTTIQHENMGDGYPIGQKLNHGRWTKVHMLGHPLLFCVLGTVDDSFY